MHSLVFIYKHKINHSNQCELAKKTMIYFSIFMFSPKKEYDTQQSFRESEFSSRYL